MWAEKYKCSKRQRPNKSNMNVRDMFIMHLFMHDILYE